jgi:hypothetical protein
MQDEQTTYTYYALSVKGGFYNAAGMVVEEIGAAQKFKTKKQAIEFREFHDPIQKVDCSTLVVVQMALSELDD